jgi:hypothetical protein
MKGGIGLVLLVAAVVCFGIAAFWGEPYRVRLVALGLFFEGLSRLV